MTRALRAAFKISSMYRPDHPAFKSGVDDLLARIEALSEHLSPLTIGFTPHALHIDGRFRGDDPAYRDLARLFHFRKIKRMEIRPGLPREEFMRFSSKIMLPVKAFVKEGGARAILERERIVHIALEVLDYSQILQGEGEEIKDIWPYLLMEAVEENDGGKLDEPAGSFEKVVGRHQELLNLVSVKTRDMETFVHLLNVTLLVMFFGAKLKLSKDDVLDLGIASLYHDVGKLSVSLDILKKKSRLDDGELSRIQNHPVIGAAILDAYKDTLGILPVLVAYEHHLRYDMTGYPRSPFARRPHPASMMVSICDVYDALALKRTYKNDYPPEKILEVMMLERGKIFDPDLLDKFFQFMGAWPVGTLAALSDGRIGVVQAVNEDDAMRPLVRVISPENTGESVDLTGSGTVRILRSINPHDEGVRYLPLIGQATLEFPDSL